MRPLVTVNDVAHAELYEHLEAVPNKYRAERIRMLATMALRGKSLGGDRTRQDKENSRANQVGANEAPEGESGHKAAMTSSQPGEADQQQEQASAEGDSHDETRREMIQGVADGW